MTSSCASQLSKKVIHCAVEFGGLGERSHIYPKSILTIIRKYWGYALPRLIDINRRCTESKFKVVVGPLVELVGIAVVLLHGTVLV